MISKINNLFRPDRLSRRRILFALFVAVVADGLQIPLQLPPAPQIIDVVAMVLTSATIGFHLLLLPTFVLELFPLVDMVPTWTGCVLAVIALRKREQPVAPPVIPSADELNRAVIPPPLGPPASPTKEQIPPRLD